ncbi:MAG: hypothetical protein KDB25_04910 [Leucobacter sp.]|nr:hypothetical protein [Leucobacter sp.]
MKSRVTAELWRLGLAVLWFGMVGAIGFIEAPLKFLAPGITIPLGLGIGRLVFTALNISEGLLLVALIAVSLWPRAARPAKDRLLWLVGLAVLFVFKLAVVRPPLNARTDLVLAGADPGQSAWHYVYIACDLVTLALLLVLAFQAARAVRGLVGARPDPDQAPRPAAA